MNKDNVKYIIPNTYGVGSSENIFYPNGTPVNDPANMATYNYVSPVSIMGIVGHAIFDVAPYYIWGNSLDDPTTFLERIFASYEGGTQCN